MDMNKNRLPNNCERDHMLNLFPQEVWLHIFDSIKDATELESLSESSPFFRECLSLKPTEFLFPGVWKVLEARFLRLVNSPPTVITASPCVECGKFRNSGGDLEVLHLRLVSKRWCSAVDTAFRNNPRHYHMKGDVQEDAVSRRHGALRTAEYFWEGRAPEVDEFLAHFEGTHGTEGVRRSPFLAREIILMCQPCPTPSTNAGGSEIVRLFTRYGHYILYLTVVQAYQTSSVDFLHKLGTWLRHLPNLKVLSVNFQTNEEPSCSQVPDLLPKLDRLQFLRTISAPASVFHELIRVSGNISMLETYKSGPGVKYDIEAVGRLNLKQVSLQFFTETDLQSLSAPFVTWRQLQKMYLDFDKACDSLPWAEIFRILERQWGHTLTQVMLQLPKITREEDSWISEECSLLRLNLPHVTRLKLGISNASTLDFLLPMAGNLEVLEVTFQEFKKFPRGIKKSRKHQIHGYLLDSDIWTLFSKLKRVNFCLRVIGGQECWNVATECYSHTREDWDRYCKDQRGVVAVNNDRED